MHMLNETTPIVSKSVRVVIYDNLRLVGAGLESILTKNQNLEVIGKYHSFPPMISLLRAQPDVDLLLLSLTSLNNGELDWIETICQSSRIPILVLCQTIDLIGIKQAFGFGIKGCVALDDDSFEIDCAIQSISQGQQFLSSAIGLSTMSCTNPLKGWTKLSKQFRSIKLGNYEKREKGIQPGGSFSYCSGRSARREHGHLS